MKEIIGLAIMLAVSFPALAEVVRPPGDDGMGKAEVLTTPSGKFAGLRIKDSAAEIIFSNMTAIKEVDHKGSEPNVVVAVKTGVDVQCVETRRPISKYATKVDDECFFGDTAKETSLGEGTVEVLSTYPQGELAGLRVGDDVAKKLFLSMTAEKETPVRDSGILAKLLDPREEEQGPLNVTNPRAEIKVRVSSNVKCFGRPEYGSDQNYVCFFGGVDENGKLTNLPQEI
jgi:hypothetical protein